MVLLAHALTGAIIGTKISNPFFVATLCFISHIILDSIPHVNLPIPRKADPLQILKTLPDVIPSIGVYFLFLVSFPEHWISITIGVTFAILIDLISLFKLVPGINNHLAKFYEFHDRIQRKERLFLGLIVQVIYIIFMLNILRF